MKTETKPVYAKSWQHLAIHMVHQRKAMYDAYEEDVRDWYRNGDGRPTREGGRGHTYPECIHGYSRWTDYDNICGSCEDGYGSYNYLRELEVAKEMAKDSFQEFHDRLNFYIDLRRKILNTNLPVTIDETAMNDWVQAPIRMN